MTSKRRHLLCNLFLKLHLHYRNSFPDLSMNLSLQLIFSMSITPKSIRINSPFQTLVQRPSFTAVFYYWKHTTIIQWYFSSTFSHLLSQKCGYIQTRSEMWSTLVVLIEMIQVDCFVGSWMSTTRHHCDKYTTVHCMLLMSWVDGWDVTFSTPKTGQGGWTLGPAVTSVPFCYYSTLTPLHWKG